MISKDVDLAIIGGGPAGLSAAIAAKKSGINNILIIERNEMLGGILNQCIHDGFGIEIFNERLTGPEYAQRYIDKVKELGIEYTINSMVLDMSSDKILSVISPKGLMKFNAKAVILAMGCRERTRGNICIPGFRPAGIYTAGCAQNLINIRNYMIGKDIVILGSGDIGLIMARRLTLEGAKVHAIVEILPYSSGLPRNTRQCLEDYGIPLYLKHTVISINGLKRVESVTIADVDDKFNPIEGTEKNIKCDTLLLSVGLIPENELSLNANIGIDPITGGPIVNENLETSVEGIFACGNVLHVHDVVDYVTIEAEKAGISASNYIKGEKCYKSNIKVIAGDGVRYVIPHRISGRKDVCFSLRVNHPGRNKIIVLKDKDGRIIKEIYKIKVNPAEMIQFVVNKRDLNKIRELMIELKNQTTPH